MRSGILFFIVFVSVTFSGIAQERHLKNAKAFIEKGTFEKAMRILLALNMNPFTFVIYCSQKTLLQL
jgi:hypothetical protein